MTRVTLALILYVAAASVAASAGQVGPESPAWFEKRLALWRQTCLATAPNFSGFYAALRSSGFKANGKKSYSYQQTEIAASLQPTGRFCNCMFSFGTVNQAADRSRFIKFLVDQRAGQFEPDDDPKSLGVLFKSKEKVAVRLLTFRHDNLDWIGITMKGPKPCPSA